MKVQYSTNSEPWTVYKLDDGTEVKIKNVLIAANRCEGEFLPDGNPKYNLNFQSLIHIDAPDGLKQLPNVHQVGNA